MDNEEIIRNAYRIAEAKDTEGWLAAFTPDGTFTDESIGVTYRGQDRTFPLDNYGRAFSDMHRELHQVYVNGDMVIVQLALQGTHDGPLQAGDGIIAPTGNRMDAPCCDVFQLRDGRIERFDCYPSGTVILAQLGVLGALDAAITRS
ncbi:nuclear transport factor 2 family protein [Pseudofrankia sp. BMG5.36]|uniref:nuclear transport factor 2 family protein n=2 Tax=unclassified Pseudofrankia TaxID=2994372 RepID=UPI0008DA7B88|nr:nuclear transport factor 2 family protein [Pseudofrankia sp. BMG5.36]OHV47396.1 ketosteroid isomerase [Pseudofrankia sp. BMG5.36]